MSSLLDSILSILHSIKDDEAKLRKLHDFMVNEIYEEPAEEMEIPEKYRTLINSVVQDIEAELVCYINPSTQEVVAIPKNILLEIDIEEEMEDDDLDDYAEFRSGLKRVYTEWEKFITVEPPDAHESFVFMERFAETLSDARLKTALQSALRKPKPFRNFNAIIHQSAQREVWFRFREKELGRYAAASILHKLT